MKRLRMAHARPARQCWSSSSQVPLAVQEQSIPVVDYYEEKGKVKRISAVPPPDEVFLKVEQILDGLQVTSPS